MQVRRGKLVEARQLAAQRSRLFNALCVLALEQLDEYVVGPAQEGMADVR